MRSTVIVVAIAGLLAVGCGTGEKKRLEGELAQSQSRVTELEQSVAQSTTAADSLRSTLTQIQQQNQRMNDSLDEALHAAVTKSQRLQASLQSARDQYRKSVDSLNQVNTGLMDSVRSQLTRITGLESQLTTVQADLDKTRGQRDNLLAFNDQMRPWFDYYKKEAGRNWLKKVFGAGRGQKPTTTEPAFPSAIPADLEAANP